MSGAGNNAFFAGAWRNHQMPQSIFNGPSGALPPADTSGYSNGLNAQADAKINYNSTLLGDLLPYAYGKPGRLSSQTAYLAIPHMLQKVVPVLSLPTARWPCNETTRLFHSVDDGDVAFVMNFNRDNCKHAEGIQIFDKVGALRAIDPFCNLVTVNYLLAGIQMYSDIDDPHCSSWRQFIRDIDMFDSKVMHQRIHTSWQVLKIIRDIFVPFGVPRGSDKQGGQSQGTNAPDIFPVDHVTSMLMDGKCQNIVNLWRANAVSAGDEMILVMRKIVPTDYVLSRQANSYNRQRFGGWPDEAGTNKINLEERRREGVWQLVPQVYNMADEPETPSEYDYRENGYWHVCRALQQSGANPQHKYDNYNDATQYQKTGELLEVSFQPLFVEGLASGSSRAVISTKDAYPVDKEMLGISTSLNAIPRFGANGYRVLNRQVGGGAGPDPAALFTYLRAQFPKAHARKGDLMEGKVIRRRMEIAVEAFAAPVVAEAGVGADVAAGGEGEGGGEGIGGVWGGGEDVMVGVSVGMRSTPDTAAAGTLSSKPAGGKSAGGKGGGSSSKKAAAPTVMGLAGSYISGSNGGDSTGAGSKKGSVRASLLTAHPPPQNPPAQPDSE